MITRRHRASGATGSSTSWAGGLGSLVAVVLMSLASMTFVVADELPLPKGAHVLDEPVEATLGSQAMKLNGFTTWLSVAEIRAFYERSLPKQGWHVETIPWIASTEDRLNRLEQGKREHLDVIKKDPLWQEKLASIRPDTIRTVKQQSLYATRGDERLLLNMMTSSDYRQPTMVSVSRWVASSHEEVGNIVSGGESPSKGLPSEMPTMLSPELGRHPCCSGASVPMGARKLPSSVPVYPNARVIVSGGSPTPNGSQTTVTEISLTNDSTEQVADYFQRQMAYNGWSPLELSKGHTPDARELLGPQASALVENMKTLSFQNDRSRCNVTIAEQSRDVMGAVQQMSGLPEALVPKETASIQKTRERTMILVTYFENKTVMDLLHKVSPATGIYGH